MSSPTEVSMSDRSFALRNRNRYDIGYELLGPIFYSFCYKLWANHLALSDRETVAAFLARGGIRLKHFYEIFLQANGLNSPVPLRILWTSRLAAYTAAAAIKPECVHRLIASEYSGMTVQDAVECWLPRDRFREWQSADVPSEWTASPLKRQEILLSNAFHSQGAAGHILRCHVKEQFDLLQRHLAQISEGRKEIWLVDTGWSGSIVQSMKEVAQRIEVGAHFFGYRYPPGMRDPDIQGVIFESSRFKPGRPFSILLEFRHLIEDACEVSCPSVRFLQEVNGKILPDWPHETVAESTLLEDAHPTAVGIAHYIAEHRSGIRPAKIERNACQALRSLKQLICFPNKNDVRLLAPDRRTRDFGTTDELPVVLPAEKNLSWKQRKKRIDRDLWAAGQIAIDFQQVRLPLQLMWLNRDRRFIFRYLFRRLFRFKH